MRYGILGPGITHFFKLLFQFLRAAILMLNVLPTNRLIRIIAQIVWRICHQQKPKLKKTGELSFSLWDKNQPFAISTLFHTIIPNSFICISYSSCIW